MSQINPLKVKPFLDKTCPFIVLDYNLRSGPILAVLITGGPDVPTIAKLNKMPL